MLRRNGLPTEVEVPIAPMLDMAFLLLAFFVMTFNPTPIEVQYTMNLLPGQAQARPEEGESDDAATADDIPAALRTLTADLLPDAEGGLERVVLGENQIVGIEPLRAELKRIASDESLPFDQALLRFDPDLHYGALVEVIDAFYDAGIKKINFTELTQGGFDFGPSL